MRGESAVNAGPGDGARPGCALPGREDPDGHGQPEPARECVHVPDPSTAYTTACLAADLARPDSYPADAVCLGCEKPVRCGRLGQPWYLKYPERA